MRDLEIVVFDASGREIDRMDPYESHEDYGTYVDAVQATGTVYRIDIPTGGRYEIREMTND